MTITTHLSVLVDFWDKLDEYRANNTGSGTPITVLSHRLGFDPSSVKFAKALLFIHQFCLDTVESVRMSSIKETNKEVVLGMLQPLIAPFRFPFPQDEIPNIRNSALSHMVRSHIDLLNDIMIREVAFLVPTAEQIDRNLKEMEKLRTRFSKLELSPWLKDDFEQTLNLHVALLAAFPEMSHRVLFETQKTLSSYLSLSLAPQATRALIAGLVAVNALIAAFVLPSEAYEAGRNYYGWILGPATGAPLLPAAALMPQLPAPVADQIDDGSKPKKESK